jgi:hypothetical protein
MDLTALSNVSLPAADGTTVRLGDTWHDQPVVLVFLRHFG